MKTCFTRTGDQGETCILTGERISKSEQRLEAIGSIDELNSFLGWAASFSKNKEVKKTLQAMQNDLFSIGAELAGANSNQKTSRIRISSNNIVFLENLIRDIEEKIPVQKKFIVPSGAQSAMTLNVARSVCRRAERVLVKLNDAEGLNPSMLSYVNRMSDLLHVLTRLENLEKNVEEKNPVYHFN